MRQIVLALLAVLLPVGAQAQQDPSYSHYWAMEPSFCPAAVGKQDKLNVAGAYNMTLTGFEHNPRTMYIAADMPFMLFKAKHGVGLQIVNDQIGLFRHQKLALQYAYKHRLFGGVISAGVLAGLISENFDGSAFESPMPFSNSARSGRPVSARRTRRGKKRSMSGKQTQTVFANRARCATAEPGMALASWRTTGMPSERAARTGAIEV